MISPPFNKFMLSKNKTGWLLLSPTILILVLVGLVPFFYVLYVGFFNWTPLAVDLSLQFAGLVFNFSCFLCFNSNALLFCLQVQRKKRKYCLLFCPQQSIGNRLDSNSNNCTYCFNYLWPSFSRII